MKANSAVITIFPIIAVFADKMAAPDLELKKAFGELQAKMIDTKQVRELNSFFHKFFL